VGSKGKSDQTTGLFQVLLTGSRSFHRALTGKAGRFRMLHIEDAILPRSASDNKEKWVPQPVTFGNKEDSAPSLETVVTMMPRLWKQECRHTVITGEGGMGKTVSLVRLWQELLEQKNFYVSSVPSVAKKKTGIQKHSNQKLLQGVQGGGLLEKSPTGACLPIPVFIALHEFNHRSGSAVDFIRSYIIRNYLDDAPLKDGSMLNGLFKKAVETPDGVNVPSVVLLLDGFNEITVEKRELLLEINRLTEQCEGLQVVMTSRSDMRSNFNWSHWNLVQLEPLDDPSIAGYLTRRGMAVPTQEVLKSLIRNPMMLTLYAASCELQEKYKTSSYCSFKERVETPAELLWNFMEAQVGNLPERLGHDQSKIYYYKFVLKYFLPALGFEMEKARLFDFNVEQMDACIDRLCMQFSQPDFLDTFPEFDEYVDCLPLGECGNHIEQRKRRSELKRILCDELHMVVKESESSRFLHQDFRDFFAAVHILNRMEVGIRKKEVPDVLKERVLDYFVRRMMGEIEGEHYSKPYICESEKSWRIYMNKENRLHKVLDLCRGQFGQEVDYAVWNIVTIWKEVRGELTGADLTGLDLTGVGLNRVRCSRFYGEKYLAAVFDGSRVHERNLLPQGHLRLVSSAVYSRDGKKILSASEDQTIKEWDAETGMCVRTLEGHTSVVTGAVYSPDGKKILSASLDKTIKEWDAETGQCVRTLEGHTESVRSAVYSPDGTKILSASRDNTIKEWDAETGPCVRTLEGHMDTVRSAVYSRDGTRILSASEDQTIKEWDAETRACLQTLVGHTYYVTSAVYSPDGKKILSASSDKTIKEWDAETGACVQTITGHTAGVRSAVYSPDGGKILSASSDSTIKEWDAETGMCVKTTAGHTFQFDSAIYSMDRTKILSVLWDGTIEEWDAETSQCVKTFAGHTDTVTSKEYSRDEKKILSASEDQTIKEWDAETGECVRTLEGHTSVVTSAVYSPDGKKILSASYDYTIKEWDAETGVCVKTLIGHTDGVNSAVYSPDGERILSASWDHTIKEWDAETGQCLETYQKVDHPDLSEYHTGETNRKLRTYDNKIVVQEDSGNIIKELTTIPGLFIHGCWFQNLEKGSEWSEEGVRILNMYHGKI